MPTYTHTDYRRVTQGPFLSLIRKLTGMLVKNSTKISFHKIVVAKTDPQSHV